MRACAITSHLDSVAQAPAGLIHGSVNTILYSFTAHGHGITGATVKGICTVQIFYQGGGWINVTYPVTAPVGASSTFYGGTTAPVTAVLAMITESCRVVA